MFLTIIFSTKVNSVEVIVNASVNVDTLTQSQLRRIYSMRQLHWFDEQKIIVFVLPSSHPLHQRFSKEKLGVFSYKLDRIWNKLIYSGLGTAPIVVSTQEALIDAVANTDGAIGYIEEENQRKEAYVVKVKG